MTEYANNPLAFESGNYKPERKPSHGPLEYSARRILFVDDEQDHRFLYEQELREEGYLVLSAGNGKEALRCLEESPFDLVILDIVMPKMDGIETLGKIATRYKKMPVILHTAYPYYQTDFMTWLAHTYVVKSSDLSVLKKTVKELFKKEGKMDSSFDTRGGMGFNGAAP